VLASNNYVKEGLEGTYALTYRNSMKKDDLGLYDNLGWDEKAILVREPK
jgi:hypothetical protein